jgi:phosphoribosylformimino-5-aminoimidazole carboxamide ribotide isomerase
MIIYPAMDIISGDCVRLQKGDFGMQTTYSRSPYDQALTFKQEGSEWLHIIDLTGAKEGIPGQKNIIQDIASKTGLKVQTGGGIRTIENARDILNSDIDRIILGTMAIATPQIVNDLLNEFDQSRFVIALDTNKIGGLYYIATHGWQETSDLTLSSALDIFSSFGIINFLITDISKDGLLQGPNIELYEEFCQKFPNVGIQASGGVSSLNDLPPLLKTGASGIIIGKAIYEGLFSFKDAQQTITAALC